MAFHPHATTPSELAACRRSRTRSTLSLAPGERYDVILHMNNPGIWMAHDHIDHHVSNNGVDGGSMLVIEYEEIEPDDWYMWKDVAYDPDFYMSESLKKPHGVHRMDAFRGVDPEAARRRGGR